MRTFIAIELDAAVQRPLVKLLRGLPRLTDVRWVTESQLHVTLKFLGDVADSQITRVCDIVRTTSAQVEPFPLRVQGLGCFPGPRNPRVLWSGVEDPTGSCARWVQLADPLFEAMNFKPETRGFTPHLTLGRSRSTTGSNGLQRVLDDTAAPDMPEMFVEEVVVFESRLLPGGAQYHALARIPLGAEG